MIAIGFIIAGWLIVIQLRDRRARQVLPPAAPFDVLNYSPSKFIEIEGSRIHYIQEGQGPDLLLVHGIGASIVSWATNFAELKKNFRVTALDLPGFGRSDKRLDVKYDLDDQTRRLAAFIVELGLHSPFIVAHSMGAAIAGMMAKKNPRMAKKIIFLAPALNRWLVAIHPSLFAWFIHSTKKFIVTRSLVRWIYTKRVAYRLPPNTEALIDGYFQPYEKSPELVEIFWRHSHLLRDRRLPNGLKNFETPSLVLLGDHDRVMPNRYLKKFLQMNPQIEFLIVPNCGHQIMEEDPRFFLETVQRFFV